MEFSEKLQTLRKRKGITQEELAKSLFVSRTAVSKWESGRGYPSLEYLKETAKFFSVSVDELLSNEELLTVAERDNERTKNGFRHLIFGLLDLSVVILLFLPFFAQKVDGVIREVTVFDLTEISPYLKILYFLLICITVVWGGLTLVFQNEQKPFWLYSSFGINLFSVILFMMSLQPYPALLSFVFLSVKTIIFIKRTTFARKKYENE